MHSRHKCVVSKVAIITMVMLDPGAMLFLNPFKLVLGFKGFCGNEGFIHMNICEITFVVHKDHSPAIVPDGWLTLGNWDKTWCWRLQLVYTNHSAWDGSLLDFGVTLVSAPMFMMHFSIQSTWTLQRRYFSQFSWNNTFLSQLFWLVE